MHFKVQYTVPCSPLPLTHTFVANHFLYYIIDDNAAAIASHIFMMIYHFLYYVKGKPTDITTCESFSISFHFVIGGIVECPWIV